MKHKSGGNCEGPCMEMHRPELKREQRIQPRQSISITYTVYKSLAESSL